MAKKELFSGDVPIPQKDDLVMPHDAPFEREPDIILVEKQKLDKDYADQLKFNEEPVTIMISQSAERFAPQFVDLWCQGIGAEILMKGRWVPVGALPIGTPVTTKRKYCEILANSKTDTIMTKTLKPGDDPDDRVSRQTIARAPFTVINPQPRDQEWLNRIMRYN